MTTEHRNVLEALFDKPRHLWTKDDYTVALHVMVGFMQALVASGMYTPYGDTLQPETDDAQRIIDAYKIQSALAKF